MSSPDIPQRLAPCCPLLRQSVYVDGLKEAEATERLFQPIQKSLNSVARLTWIPALRQEDELHFLNLLNHIDAKGVAHHRCIGKPQQVGCLGFGHCPVTCD